MFLCVVVLTPHRGLPCSDTLVLWMLRVSFWKTILTVSIFMSQLHTCPSPLQDVQCM